MATDQSVLQTMLSDDLSSQFLKELARRIPTIYLEAERRSLAERDVYIDDSLRAYLFWQTRYVFVQSQFVGVAKECKMESDVVRCESNGFPILTVKANRFTLTIHHSSKQDEDVVLRSSLIRQQHSAVNHQYRQGNLFETFDEQKLRNAEKIYANIIFGCRGNAAEWHKYGFLQIAVPYVKQVENKKGDLVNRLFYAEKCDYNDMLGMVIEREKKGQPMRPALKLVKPKVKKRGEKLL
jgi:hypothetical protein